MRPPSFNLVPVYWTDTPTETIRPETAGLSVSDPEVRSDPAYGPLWLKNGMVAPVAFVTLREFAFTYVPLVQYMVGKLLARQGVIPIAPRFPVPITHVVLQNTANFCDGREGKVGIHAPALSGDQGSEMAVAYFSTQELRPRRF